MLVSEWKNELPANLLIEISNICNLNCIMCHASFLYNNNIKHNKLMEYNTFQKVINQVVPGVKNIIMQLWGEPLFHPDFISMVEYIRKKTSEITLSFNTNGLLVSPNIANELLKHNINEIGFSIDAAKESTFNSIRKGGNYKQLINNIENLINQRARYGSSLKIYVSFVIMKENEIEVEPFWEFWKNKVDCVTYYIKSDTSTTHSHFFYETKYEKRFPCWNLKEQLVVDVDGNIIMCCHDAKSESKWGNVNDNPIIEIINNHKACTTRKLHNQGKMDEILLCKNCSQWTNAIQISEKKSNYKVVRSPISEYRYISDS